MKRYIRADSYKFNPNSDEVIQGIADGLNVDTNIAKFIAKINAEDIDDNGFTTDEECVNYIIDSTPERMKEILFNEGYNGLVHWSGSEFADNFIDSIILG
jgi:hypothetical protein